VRAWSPSSSTLRPMPAPSRGEGSKSRSLWPLPGGVDAYPDTLRVLLEQVRDGPSLQIAIDRLQEAFPQVRSRETARSYLTQVACALGFAQIRRGRLHLTPQGRTYLRTGSATVLRRALRERVYGVDEILEALAAGPRRIGLIVSDIANGGSGWDSNWQIRYRLRWLMGAGLVTRGDGRWPEYRLTKWQAEDSP